MSLQRRWLVIVLMVSWALAPLWTGGCGPATVPSGQDGTTSGERGNERTSPDTTNQDASTSQESTPSETPSESPGSSETSPEQSTDAGTSETVGEQTPGEQPSPSESDPGESATDGPAPETTPGDGSITDGSTQEVPPTEPTPTLCENKGGYCEATGSTCRSGYQDAGDPMECGNICCLPQAPSQCTTDNDCPSTCSGSGVCTQTLYTCVKGRCQAGQTVKQPNARCDASTGQCVRLTPGCQSACDCPQGQDCVKSSGQSQCITGTKPVYCCAKAGCPAGQACVNADGSSGTCPTPTTDCAKKGGYCTPQNTSCKSGYTLDTRVSCGNVRSLLCCRKTTNKCATVKCAGPTCAVSLAGACSQTTSTCDPATGQCVKKTGIVAPTCSMSGTSCVQSVPACSNNQCVKGSKTVARSCRQSGTSCVQVTPSCAKGQCQTASKTVANATCDKSGACVPNPPSGCQTPCDCSQGLDCVKVGSVGRCIAGFRPVYCCSKSGCPAGQTCVNKDGSSGTCPQATTDCAKKGGYCTVQFTPCKAGFKLNTSVSCGSVRALRCCLPTTNKCATVKCAGPTCTVSLAGTCAQTTSTCDPATGRCVKKTSTATSSCTMSGTSCVQSVPVCSNNQCVKQSKTLARSCRQSGTSCIQSTPTCANNQCQSTSRTIANSLCNTSTGQCTLVGTTCQRLNGTCIPQGQTCPRGTLATKLTCTNATDLCCVRRILPPTP